MPRRSYEQERSQRAARRLLGQPPDKTYDCPFCAVTFTDVRSKITHQRRAHPQKTGWAYVKYIIHEESEL